MKIAVDAMGGDHAPDEIVRGALLYRQEGGASDLVLVGREDAIRKLVGVQIPPGITIRDAKDVVGMDEHPATALRRRADTSIGVATSMVKHGEADAVVSAGNTGATMAAALLVLGRIRAGGTTVVLVEHLVKAVFGISDRVVVLSAGEKIAEGDPVQVATDERVVTAYLGPELHAVGSA